MIWAIVDVVLNLGAVIFYATTIGIMGPQLWVFLLLLADFLLIFGAWKLNTGLMIFWLVIVMINIVLIFIGLFILVIAASIGAAWFGLAQASGACSGLENLGQELGQIEGLENLGQELGQSDNTDKCNEIVEVGAGISGIIIAIGLVASILPIVSIYFWIVVNSLR